MTQPAAPQSVWDANGQTQLPDVQVRPTPQTLPHAPQLASSLCKRTQVVPHGDADESLHRQPEVVQLCAALQTIPQPPQLLGSSAGMQVSPQYTPLGQVQAPDMHTSPGEQVVPHEPQFASSTNVSTQTSPHSSRRNPQVQLPPLQL